MYIEKNMTFLWNLSNGGINVFAKILNAIFLKPKLRIRLRISNA